MLQALPPRWRSVGAGSERKITLVVIENGCLERIRALRKATQERGDSAASSVIERAMAGCRKANTRRSTMQCTPARWDARHSGPPHRSSFAMPCGAAKTPNRPGIIVANDDGGNRFEGTRLWRNSGLVEVSKLERKESRRYGRWRGRNETGYLLVGLALGPVSGLLYRWQIGQLRKQSARRCVVRMKRFAARSFSMPAIRRCTATKTTP